MQLHGLQVHNSATGLLCPERSGLSCTAGNRIEGGTATEVLEVLTRSEDDVHLLDVGCTEAHQRVRTDRGQADPEAAQFTKLDLVAIQQLFYEAAYGITEDTLHGTATEHTVVVGNVVDEIREEDGSNHDCTA